MGVTRRELIQGAALIGTVGISVENRLVAAGVNEQTTSRPILLQIYFQVDPKRSAEFEKMFAESYVPALRKQEGYLRSGLLRLFAPDVAEEIQAAPTEFNYQMELVFDTEENRRKWVASKEHVQAWPHASGMAEAFAWRGFDVVGVDRSSD
ncbi:MAG: antibiotic biosynthesis monooxygenase [Fuerstiella sp.]|nr:antibiotic biosynthesis monooxygenase [Fuerstiella sp.]